MATRPPRLKRPHTYFHVTTRGTNRWNIFLDDEDRLHFMYLLAAICKRYGIEVHAYCLMGNHLHLVVYCPEPVLSSAIRDLKSRYAKRFNRRHHGSGPVFEAPFVEVPILDDDHLMIEVRYVHRNPLDLDPTASLGRWPWSSHGIYLGLRPEPRFMNTRVVRDLFGPSYRSIVERPGPSDKVQNLVGSNLDTPGVSRLGRADDRSLAGIRREVALAAGCDVVDIRPRGRNGLCGIAALIAMRVVGFSAAEVAEPYGYKSRSGAHGAASRAAEHISNDPTLHRVYSLTVNRLAAAA